MIKMAAMHVTGKNLKNRMANIIETWYTVSGTQVQLRLLK